MQTKCIWIATRIQNVVLMQNCIAIRSFAEHLLFRVNLHWWFVKHNPQLEPARLEHVSVHSCRHVQAEVWLPSKPHHLVDGIGPVHDQQTQVWHWPNKQHIKIHVVYQIVCCCTNSALPRLSMSPLKIFRSCPSNLDVNNFCFRRVHPTLVVKCDGWGNPKSMFAKETKTRVAKNCLNQHSLSMFVRVSNLSIRMRQGTRNGPPMRTGKATEHCFGPFCALIVLF